jgi:NADH-quinone oxidoreductase subunit G
VLLGVEPERDLSDPVAAVGALGGAECVISLSAFNSPAVLAHSRVVLPVAANTESAGTHVNAEGRWQSVQGAVKPPGDARPAWKVLRVLGNLLDQPGFEHLSPVEVVDEVYGLCRQVEPDNTLRLGRRFKLAATKGLQRGGEVPIYGSDAQVRRAEALQRTPLAERACLRVSPATARRFHLTEADRARVDQEGAITSLPVVYDTGIPDDCVWIPVGVTGAEALGPAIGTVRVTPDAGTGERAADAAAADQD